MLIIGHSYLGKLGLLLKKMVFRKNILYIYQRVII